MADQELLGAIARAIGQGLLGGKQAGDQRAAQLIAQENQKSAAGREEEQLQIQRDRLKMQQDQQIFEQSQQLQEYETELQKLIAENEKLKNTQKAPKTIEEVIAGEYASGQISYDDALSAVERLNKAKKAPTSATTTRTNAAGPAGLTPAQSLSEARRKRADEQTNIVNEAVAGGLLNEGDTRKDQIGELLASLEPAKKGYSVMGMNFGGHTPDSSLIPFGQRFQDINSPRALDSLTESSFQGFPLSSDEVDSLLFGTVPPFPRTAVKPRSQRKKSNTQRAAKISGGNVDLNEYENTIDTMLNELTNGQ